MKRSYIILVLTLWLSACTSVPPALMVEHPPQISLTPFQFDKRPVVAYALGSGATRGFAHVGVLDALEKNGIQPDMIVGTSAGAVSGVLYAGGIRSQQLEDIATKLQQEQIADWSYSGRGLIRGEMLQNTINDLLQNRPIESLDIPFAATATDLVTGKQVIFTRGDAGLAARASSTIPGLVSPVVINGRDYVDGSLLSSVPVRLARKLGADIVIAVDVSRRPDDHARLDTTISIMRQALSIMSLSSTERDLKNADVIIQPTIGDLPFGDLEHRQQTIQAGRDAATEAIPKIRQLLQQ